MPSTNDRWSFESWFSGFGQPDYNDFKTHLVSEIETLKSQAAALDGDPAGIARMNFSRFVFYSFIGSLPWCLFLAYIGQKMGENWENIRTYFHGFDWVILILIVLGMVWWVWRHIKNINSKH